VKWDIKTLANKKAGSIDLDDAVFGLPERADLLARMVNWQLARRRAGTHKTKGRSEITGSKSKPFRQKGTGRARQGTYHAPQMRGGGVVFGPVPRSHAHDLPKKVRRLALKTALSSKRAEGQLVVLESTKLEEAKTKELAKALEALGLRSVLVIDGAAPDANFVRAAANLPGIDVLPECGANVYDILRCETLVLTQDAVKLLEARLR
jgi:large subunit ribosomal protein L4